MKQLCDIVSELGKALIINSALFEQEAKNASSQISNADLSYLRSIFHNPPSVPSGIDEKSLGLGQWMAVCQYVCFELIYHLESAPIDFLKGIAFGEYDWTQATALEILCRLHIDGKVSVDIIKKIDNKLPSMRYETHLYFAQALLERQKKNKDFNKIITEIRNKDFHEALNELSNA